jgi:hypothetical protein
MAPADGSAGVAGRPVAGQGEVEVAHMHDEEPVALIGGCPPLLRRRAPGSVRRRRRRMPRARPPRQLGVRDLGARGGLGSRGGLGKERDDPKAEGGGRPETRLARLERAGAPSSRCHGAASTGPTACRRTPVRTCKTPKS